MKIIHYLILILLLSPISIATAEKKKLSTEIRTYLPDGTEIKIRKDRAYYYCRGKYLLLPDADYMLADGSSLTVEEGKVTDLDLADPK